MASLRHEEQPDAFRSLAGRRGRPGDRLTRALAASREQHTAGPAEWAPEVAERFGLPGAAALGPATYFADLATPHGRRHVSICSATACFAATGGRPLDPVERELGVRPGSVSPDGGTSLQSVRCLGYCYAAPAALDGSTPCTGPSLAAQLAGQEPPHAPVIPSTDDTGDPVLLSDASPWQLWPEAVARGSAEAIRREVAASGLRGRGGAGFPVHAKWEAVRGAPGPEKVVVANGDEGDPGSFADRLLMEHFPERVLEGLALACFACGADRGVVLVRSEYPRALDSMRTALARAYADGHFGRSAHGTATALDVDVVSGAGSYVAGEETALIAGLEGGRGCARARPPYPTQRGVWDRPTVVSNVETLSAIPWIVARGGAAYARRGTAAETGTKLVCLSERFARPGAYEVDIGTPVEHIVTELGGGLKNGAELAVLQVGGPLGGFLAADALDVPLTEADLAAHGAALGHAGLVALDRELDPVEVLRHVWEFAAAESCGACSPCRVGSRRGLELATAGAPPGDEWVRLSRVLEKASLCAFGRRLPAAVRSLARAYGDRLPGWDP
ncbi:NAD(P)H-dependent oxidoreductase subunit E [Streptomyces sp. NBC_00503]|uniref:NAD(P)H-dependent oxidoreductase subunit E n=1 Tax=Streptomyces sp. NBC_00503 TaxID=2903659 RepID=UPI002E819310|nr:NAD(P)H-dependent oxidoreductase subunit E [Streptomyces sp. NBC_00503]WUD85718.1 NAD(P)H-dependent oxidoreductase subunit E [Streptomyces sp. NBC_00503]